MKALKLMVAGAVLLAPGMSIADDDWRSWPLGDRMSLSVGGFFADIDTEAAVSEVDGLEGTPIDFEDDLGLDDSETAGFASLDWRFFKRHTLNFKYYNLDRDEISTTPDVIVFDGVVFPAGIETATDFDLSVYEVSYAFSLLFDEKKNLSLGIGVTAQDIEFAIASTEFPALAADEDFIAPLPTINLGFEYAITDKWILELDAGYMNADVEISGDDFDAEIFNGNVGIQWKTFNNLGITLAYSYFSVDGEFEDDDIRAELDLEYKGPRASLDFYF